MILRIIEKNYLLLTLKYHVSLRALLKNNIYEARQQNPYSSGLPDHNRADLITLTGYMSFKVV